MYSIGHLLKAAPLTLAIAWAAPALALNPNSAEIGINSSIKSMNVTINRGGSGCAPGQQWDTTAGGCSGAQVVGSDSTTQVQTTNACPAGQAGTVNQQRSCTRNQYGWRLPGGTTATDHYDDWACSDWTTTSSSCVASTPVITGLTMTPGKPFYAPECGNFIDEWAPLLTWNTVGNDPSTIYTISVVQTVDYYTPGRSGVVHVLTSAPAISQRYLTGDGREHYSGEHEPTPFYLDGVATLKACVNENCASQSIKYSTPDYDPYYAYGSCTNGGGS